MVSLEEMGYIILPIIFESFSTVIHFYRAFYFIISFLLVLNFLKMGSRELFHNGGDLAIILEIALRNLLKNELVQKAY